MGRPRWKIFRRQGTGGGVYPNALAFSQELMEDAQKTWRKIRGYEEIENLLRGVEYKNGVMIPKANNQAAPAA